LKVGFLTIGQSPRRDVMEELSKLIPANVAIVEAGALDDLSIDEIKTKLAPQPGDTVYVTRLRNGVEVKISKEKLLTYMQTKIEYLERVGVDLIAILCSGEFPEFKAKVPIVYPDKILKGVVSGLSFRGKAAVLIPAREQIEYAKRKWSPYLEDLSVIAISPYASRDEEFLNVARELKLNGVQLVVMDCIGYTLCQKALIKRELPEAKIITTRGSLGRVLAEMLT